MNRDQVLALREQDDGRPVIVGFHRADGIHIEAEEIEPILAAVRVTLPVSILDDQKGMILVESSAVRRLAALAALHAHRLAVFDERTQ